jgi:hypothetical protein
MTTKFYPLILVAGNGAEIRFKMVYSPVEYEAFCSRYVKVNTSLKVIKTLEALYWEKMTALVCGK